VAPPTLLNGKFRILERRRIEFRAQADAIKKLTQKYNVTYMSIDWTAASCWIT